MHLRYNCNPGSPNEHPQRVMKKLGIVYQHATLYSSADQWWFWNCENIPDPLPKYIEELNVDPMEMIGFGLTKEEAENIIAFKSSSTGEKKTYE